MARTLFKIASIFSMMISSTLAGRCDVTSWTGSGHDFYDEYVAPNKDQFNCIKYQLDDGTTILEAVAPDSADANGYPTSGGCPAGSHRVKIKGSKGTKRSYFWIENDSNDALRNEIGSLSLTTDFGFLYKDSNNEQKYYQAYLTLSNKATNAFYVLKHTTDWSAASSNVKYRYGSTIGHAQACETPACPLGPMNLGYGSADKIQAEFDNYIEPLKNAGGTQCLTITQDSGVHVLQFKSGVCANTDGEWEVKISSFRKRVALNPVIVQKTEYLVFNTKGITAPVIDWKKEFQHCVASMLHNYRGFTSAASGGYTTWDGQTLENPTPCKIGFKWNDGTSDKYIQWNPQYLMDEMWANNQIKMRYSYRDCEGPDGYNVYYCDQDLHGFWPHQVTTAPTCVPPAWSSFDSAAADPTVSDTTKVNKAKQVANSQVAELGKVPKDETNEQRKAVAAQAIAFRRAAAKRIASAGIVTKTTTFEVELFSDDTEDPPGFVKEVVEMARAKEQKLKYVASVGSNVAEAKTGCTVTLENEATVVMGVGDEVGDWGIMCNPSGANLILLEQKGDDKYDVSCYENATWTNKNTDAEFGDLVSCSDGSEYYVGSIAQTVDASLFPWHGLSVAVPLTHTDPYYDIYLAATTAGSNSMCGPNIDGVVIHNPTPSTVNLGTHKYKLEILKDDAVTWSVDLEGIMNGFQSALICSDIEGGTSISHYFKANAADNIMAYSRSAGGQDAQDEVRLVKGDPATITMTYSKIDIADDATEYHRMLWPVCNDYGAGTDKCFQIFFENNEDEPTRACVDTDHTRTVCAAGEIVSGYIVNDINLCACVPSYHDTPQCLQSNNEHVFNHTCVACPAGTSSQGDAWPQLVDTTCVGVLCAENEYVAGKACTACPAGTTNAAGDDASGANTTCNPTLCLEDEHVVSNVCVTCPTGQGNEVGDDASGDDTDCYCLPGRTGANCDPILCSVNKHVVSHECVVCPPGSTNEAGDDASNVSTICDPVLCGLDEHVVSNECVACPPGTNNTADDDASGTDTVCDPILCLADEYVVNNTCVACDTGDKNDAGDDSSGSNTQCYTPCAESQHVQGGSCVACAAGTTKPAGDNPEGANTDCVPILCLEDQYVESNTCKNCSTGSGAAAGADASGADTGCGCPKDHRVQANACVQCAGGSVRLAGDDTVGNDTDCGCEEDHYLSSATCTECAPGTTRPEGDNPLDGQDTACENIICGENERVAGHACVPCGAELVNKAGDDASGDNTTCYALCLEDHYVSSGACTECAPGTTRPKGDDPEGNNTACEDILCAVDERVAGHACVPCDTGLVNKAGDNASGVNTTCYALCSEDHYVSSGACTECAPGTTRPEGDDPEGGDDTVCEATLCAADEKVVSNACVACDAGQLNDAGDDASGVDTHCYTPCAENEYVQANVCQSCAAGTTRTAGDNPEGNNTACDATLCAADEKVSSHVCVACDAGDKNDAGDDASGANTGCYTPCAENQHVSIPQGCTA